MIDELPCSSIAHVSLRALLALGGLLLSTRGHDGIELWRKMMVEVWQLLCAPRRSCVSFWRPPVLRLGGWFASGYSPAAWAATIAKKASAFLKVRSDRFKLVTC